MHNSVFDFCFQWPDAKTQWASLSEVFPTSPLKLSFKMAHVIYTLNPFTFLSRNHRPLSHWRRCFLLLLLLFLSQNLHHTSAPLPARLHRGEKGERGSLSSQICQRLGQKPRTRRHRLFWWQVEPETKTSEQNKTKNSGRGFDPQAARRETAIAT